MIAILVADGYCHCGCGGKAPIAKSTDRARGIVKGQALRFVQGHNRKRGLVPNYKADPVTGCWAWQGELDRKGYGRVEPGGKRTTAHRWMYERARGPVSPELDVDHLCRNPACVNPDHLEPVTHAENVRRGAATKLTVAAVREIRSSQEHSLALAEKFGVSQANVINIRAGRGWPGV